MTCDIVTLLGERPDERTVGEVIAAAIGQPADLRQAGGVTRLYDAAGRLMLSIEPPLMVPIAGEAERLLGPEAAGIQPPIWWVDLRAAADVPDAPAVARRVADDLARRHRGLVWPPVPHAPRPAEGSLT